MHTKVNVPAEPEPGWLGAGRGQGRAPSRRGWGNCACRELGPVRRRRRRAEGLEEPQAAQHPPVWAPTVPLTPRSPWGSPRAVELIIKPPDMENEERRNDDNTARKSQTQSADELKQNPKPTRKPLAIESGRQVQQMQIHF